MADQCGFNGGSKDVTSMVQLNLHQASEVTRDLRDLTQPFLAGPGRLKRSWRNMTQRRNVWTRRTAISFSMIRTILGKMKKLHDLHLSVIFIMKDSLGYLSYTLIPLVKYKIYLGRKESSLLVRLLTPHFHDLCGERQKLCVMC